jgi:hypothetical protein
VPRAPRRSLTVPLAALSAVHRSASDAGPGGHARRAGAASESPGPRAGTAGSGSGPRPVTVLRILACLESRQKPHIMMMENHATVMIGAVLSPSLTERP